jgi:hypothetical protein
MEYVIPDVKPALLTRSEVEWLKGSKNVSKAYEYKLKSELKSKLRTFTELELPLLAKAGYIQNNNDLTAYSKILTPNCKVDNEQEIRSRLYEKSGWGEIRTLDHLCVRQVS